ncbi:MFS transporter [Paraburkholderia strydomiana]|uniref:MFS transporter n=1 Tax=Paraburkholderia strydomiana TaxID=1245417 RepID=UPI002856E53F|nr:MFS family permease [Paraburkholderia strydomiana]
MQAQISRTRQSAVLVALFIAWFVAYADRIVIGTAIIPIAKEFALSDTEKGYVLGAFYVTYALMQLGGGWLADRHGSRKVLVGCLLVWSVFTALTGTAWSLASLVAFRMLFGVGEGSFSPANASAVAETFPQEVRGRAQSLMSSTAFLGSAVGTALVGWTIYHYGWRLTFPLLGALGLLVAVSLFFALPSRSRAEAGSVAAGGRSTWREIAGSTLLWRIAAIWFGSCIISLGLQSWMPSYLLRVHGIDILHIGMVSAVPFAAAFLGTIATGYLIDRSGPRVLKPFLAGGALLSALFLALMTTTTSLPALIVFWTLCMVSYVVVYATVFAIPLKQFPRENVGRTIGIINFGGQIAGAVAPVAMGHLITLNHGSYLSAFYLLIGAGVMAFIVALTCNFDTKQQPASTTIQNHV